MLNILHRKTRYSLRENVRETRIASPFSRHISRSTFHTSENALSTCFWTLVMGKVMVHIHLGTSELSYPITESFVASSSRGRCVMANET